MTLNAITVMPRGFIATGAEDFARRLTRPVNAARLAVMEEEAMAAIFMWCVKVCGVDESVRASNEL